MTSTKATHKLFHAARSEELSAQIAKVIPGGVDSPFRSFKEVGGHTIFFSRAQGSKLYDEDGNVFIDFLGAWGPAILGHCVPEVVRACREALSLAPVFGAPCRLELELAKKVIEAVPSMEMVRFVNSGTEAVMSAVRLARGYTERDLIIMFEGCYHGHSDSVLSSRDHSSSKGIPQGFSNNTLLVPFNNAQALEQCLKSQDGQVAAVVIEPIAGSMGVIPPQPGYLQRVRELCSEHGALLIFDEVLTGFRVARGGAQELYSIRPDLTCFGKALGGGMPIGAYGGSSRIMNYLEPIGKVYQAGTFSGNPVTMAGGIATLDLLADPSVYERLEARASQFVQGLQPFIEKQRLPLQLQRVGSMFSIIFAAGPVTNYRDSLSIDSKAFSAFFHEMLRQGVYLPPSSVDAAAISASHSEDDIELAINACKKALTSLPSAIMPDSA